MFNYQKVIHIDKKKKKVSAKNFVIAVYNLKSRNFMMFEK
jgi:precorrin-3B methylase